MIIHCLISMPITRREIDPILEIINWALTISAHHGKEKKNKKNNSITECEFSERELGSIPGLGSHQFGHEPFQPTNPPFRLLAHYFCRIL